MQLSGCTLEITLVRRPVFRCPPSQLVQSTEAPTLPSLFDPRRRPIFRCSFFRLVLSNGVAKISVAPNGVNHARSRALLLQSKFNVFTFHWRTHRLRFLKVAQLAHSFPPTESFPQIDFTKFLQHFSPTLIRIKHDSNATTVHTLENSQIRNPADNSCDLRAYTLLISLNT